MTANNNFSSAKADSCAKADLKVARPMTPGTRHKISIDRSNLYKGKPEKTLVSILKSTGGRNNLGRITCRHKGGGVKKKYRLIDFKQKKEGEIEVLRIEYDPNRTAFIALVKYTDGELRYILAPKNAKTGDVFVIGKGATMSVGDCLPLSEIPIGSSIYNVELHSGKGGIIARSAGTSVQLLGRSGSLAQLKLPSGKRIDVSIKCKATIGVVSNDNQKNTKIGKAGVNRNKGVRPTVRGTAMNPCDHPHGGKGFGIHPKTPWGQLTKGYKTASRKKKKK